MSLASTLHTVTNGVRSALSPDKILQEARFSLEETLTLITYNYGGLTGDPTAEAHAAAHTRLHAEAQTLSANNSLIEARGLRKKVEQLEEEVRQHCKILRLETLKNQGPQ